MMLCSLILAVKQLLTMAVMCCVLSVEALLISTTALADMNLEHVHASAAELWQTAWSFMKLCLAASCLLAQVTTNAFITGTKELASYCSWSRQYLATTCSQLVNAYLMEHTPVSQRILSEQYSDL
tara:strand:+ start:268 stop:642 length:375 start_codon:yes stop_codon:yes gene_type:complete